MVKVTQILKILYPNGIAVEDVCEVYETVIPQIQKLVDGVGVGYTNAEDVVVVSVVDAVHDDESNVDLVANVQKPPEKEVTELVTNVQKPPAQEAVKQHTPTHTEQMRPKNLVVPAEVKVHINDFMESAKNLFIDEWKESEHGDCVYYKNGKFIVIKGDSSRIDTTWDYLCEYFDRMSDQTVIRDIPSLNPKKRVALARFYNAHPNFSCHIEKIDGVNCLVKDEVRVNPATRGTYEGGAMDVSGYSATVE